MWDHFGLNFEEACDEKKQSWLSEWWKLIDKIEHEILKHFGNLFTINRNEDY